ncbi:MAG TPA: hypothetical protein VGG39_08725 [Polyangiaceae bacterium]|jgi:hypothetical protein
MAAKTKTFNMRLSDEEWTRFEVVAEHYEMPVAQMLRFLVRRESDWLAPATSFAHALQKRDRRDLMDRERARILGAQSPTKRPRRSTSR